ncbi:MAG: hybrid sensor histidine kinase/response regulator [Magnetococcales bacterium]|nr:hybrid sensor histidine kinase/response regulator [Magnetococcales bacterium]
MNMLGEANEPIVKSKILIVDDTPANVKLLVSAMIHQYEVLVANEGQTALQLAEREHPDLILLDIMMPGMDGYAVCRQLKSQDKTTKIQIIFITAMGGEVDEMMGLQIGAIDYITKPFSIPIVLSRVATHLALRHSYLQIERQYAALREMEQLRKDVEAIVRHDMKSPIDGMIGCLNLLLRKDSEDGIDVRSFLKMLLDSAHQLREMVNVSLNLVKIEQGTYNVELKPVDLLPILRRILTDHQSMIKRKNIEIHLLVNGHPEQERDTFTILGDDTLCYTMIANLFRNALEASRHGHPVHISLQTNEHAELIIHNNGMVPKEIQTRFFDKYVTYGKKCGTGLGTYSARLMAETQKGSISLHSSEEEGTTVTIVLLKEEEKDEHFDRR